jgi:hypothetical protein
VPLADNKQLSENVDIIKKLKIEKVYNQLDENKLEVRKDFVSRLKDKLPFSKIWSR